MLSSAKLILGYGKLYDPQRIRQSKELSLIKLEVLYWFHDTRTELDVKIMAIPNDQRKGHWLVEISGQKAKKVEERQNQSNEQR